MKDFQELRYFVAALTLSRELNEPRAARQLKISRAALRTEISDLERAYSIKLFGRRGSHIVVTEAGRAFLNEAHLSLLRDQSALKIAKAAADNVESTLTIGRTPYTDPVLTATMMSVALPLYPKLRLTLHSDFALDLVEGLLSSKLDLALVANPPPTHELTCVKVTEAPFYIALPHDHLLTQKPSVTLTDLATDTWIIFERKVHPGMYDAILSRAKEDGIVVSFGPSIVTVEEADELVSRSVGVAFINKPGADSLAKRGTAVRPLLDKEVHVDVCLAWRADNRSELVRSFANAFMERVLQAEQSPEADADARRELPVQKLRISRGGGQSLLNVAEIEWIESEDYYAAIHAKGTRLLYRESLSSLEKRLDEKLFVRIHRGAIVNLSYVKDILNRPGRQAVIVLRDGVELPLSRRRRSQITECIRRFVR